MAEKINIAEFDIDVEAVTAAAAKTAKAIQEIKNEQSALAKEGKNTDEAFIRNAVNLRGLQKDYNAQLRVIDSYMNATNKQVNIQQRIDAALNREANTVEQLRKQSQEFIKIRNQVNIETEEGAKQIAFLNSQIDANNEAIKENVSGYEQQKLSIGGYTDAIKEALGGTNLFTGSLGDVQNMFNALTPIFNNIYGEIKDIGLSFKNATSETEGMTAAQKASAVATNLTSSSLKLLKVALLATGIGAFVVLLGSLVAYLNSSEQASNRFSKILKTIGGVVKALIRQLEPLGELLMDGIAAAFDYVGRTADRTLNLISNGLRRMGFENASKKVEGFSKSMNEAAKMAGLLADREEKYTAAQRRANMVMLQYQRDAEKLRQIRDDETLSISRRQKANDDLGAILKEQLATEKQIAIQALEIANLRIAADGSTASNLDAQAEAMERIMDIQERITGQESEQLTNRVSLQKEAAAKAKEAADAEIARKEKEAELASANFERELSQFEDRIALESALSKVVGLTRIKEEEKRAEELKTARAKLQEDLFQSELITEQQYRDELLKIDNEYLIRRNELAIQNDELLKQSRLDSEQLNFETALANLEAQGNASYEIAKLNVERERELAIQVARDKFTDEAQLAQAIVNINQQTATALREIDKSYADAKWQIYADLAGSLAQLLGEETIAGKAAAIAQATINTYLGATKALATLPPPLSFVAAASTVATGLSSVAKIVGLGTPKTNINANRTQTDTGQPSYPTINALPGFAQGGKVNGGTRIRRSNGDNVLATLKIGEVVLNQRQQMALGGDSTFAALGVPGFASGGLVTGSSNSTVQSMVRGGSNKLLADTIGKAVRDGARIGTESGAKSGIVDATTENYLRNLSSF